MIAMFIGPSSSGKDTYFYKTILKYSLNPIILSTTRPMRVGEIDKKTYYFISQEKMDLLEKEGKLVERRNYQTINGIWSYATNSENIDISKNYLVSNTWEAYKKYINFYGESVIIPIYFQVDDDIRLERALARERKQAKPNYEEYCRRFLADSKDFTEKEIDLYNPYIINNNGTQMETEKQLDNVMKLILKK